MRICIDARSLQDPEPSGVASYTRLLTHALCSTYPEDHFVLFTNGFKHHHSIEESFGTYRNCTVVSRKIPNKLLHFSFVLFGRPDFSKLTGDCDVYFFPNIIYLPRLPKHSVLTVHDLSYMKSQPYYSLRARAWHRLVKARKLLSTSKKLVAVSQATKLDIVDSVGRNEKDVYVILSAPPENTETIQKDKPKQFCVIGNIEERKNISGILLAFSRVRKALPSDTKLVFVGKRGHLRAQTKKQLNKAKAGGWVKEIGYASEKEKHSILSNSYALLFPSFYEGFGFPGLEAELLNIPVIASNRTALPEVLGMGPLYVDPHNIEMISRAITQSISQLPIQYTNPLLDRTWSDVAKEYMKLFLSLNSHT